MTSTTDRQFRPLPVPSVEVRGLFGERQDAICASTAETLLDRCVEAGMLRAIDPKEPSPGIVIPIGPWGGSHQMFWDSDIGKSIETIAYSLHRRPNPALEARVDAIIDMLRERCRTRTATSTPGSSGCSRSGGGRTCATTTSSTAPGT